MSGWPTPTAQSSHQSDPPSGRSPRYAGSQNPVKGRRRENSNFQFQSRINTGSSPFQSHTWAIVRLLLISSSQKSSCWGDSVFKMHHKVERQCKQMRGPANSPTPRQWEEWPSEIRVHYTSLWHRATIMAWYWISSSWCRKNPNSEDNSRVLLCLTDGQTDRECLVSMFYKSHFKNTLLDIGDLL